MTEVIKDIKGWEGRYTISNLGIVRSLLTGKIMKLSLTEFGYLRVNLRYKNSRKFKSYLVHRLVAGNFLENPNNYSEVNHIDCCRTNNRVDNLEWCDRPYNQRHSFRVGCHSNKGSKNPNTNLTEMDINNIKAMYKAGIKVLDIAKTYSICRSSVYNILSDNTWSNN